MADQNRTTPTSAEAPTTHDTATVVGPEAESLPVGSPPARSWTRFLTPALALVAALIVGGVAGVLIGQSTASASNASNLRGGFGTSQGGPGGFGDRQGGAPDTTGGRGGFAAGTITSIDGGTITLKKADGTTVKVSTTDGTAVTKSSAAKVSDLSAGDTVTVIGQTDSSGNVTATRIAEGDTGFGVIGGRGPGGAPTASPTP